MKSSFFLTGLMAVLLSCNNSGTNNAEKSSDTSGHTATSNTNATNAGGQNHMKTMHDAMNMGIQQMHDMKPTGDPDYDFALMDEASPPGSC